MDLIAELACKIFINKKLLSLNFAHISVTLLNTGKRNKAKCYNIKYSPFRGKGV